MYSPGIVPENPEDLRRFLQDELERISDATTSDTLELHDGVQIPEQLVDKATIYIDSADGDLKIKYSDGTVNTIVIDT